MIGRIKLGMTNQFQQVRKLKRHHAVRFQQGGETLGEIIDVRNMRIDIIAKQQIGLFSLGNQSSGRFLSEKKLQRGHPNPAGRSGGSSGRLNAQTRDARSNKILQQVAVIGCNFDHKTIRVQIKPARHGATVGRRVRKPTAAG